ncbi:ABC transporter ATP-binding protein [Aquabacter sp. L1I39]|uniref:ABC transporter ATP-binding protein n=1 Tax=Aquabacter sp. L1I39 TaxID=2820278 RepID=UPI001ADB0A21|nr:ABC transporter ATP-binding protein [Aquabacter sp. L1I39]QTL02690.1 ABC transporter ATP-binding protein [Aquabacter sp. L1I39]
MAAIDLRNIRKAFGGTEILKGVGLQVADGEFISLVGPSGCGKSTLLRIIAGLEDGCSGDIVIGGRNVAGVRPSARDLAMVFQSYALYPHLTVEENMMTPLRLRDLSTVERLPILGGLLPRRREKLRTMRSAVSDVARTLKIEPLLQRKPGQLSGGQRQRVALGRAMVRKPAAFLMDEPLSNLDAALRVHMRAELAELHRSLGTTFIYVTHDQAEALTMSNRIAVMMGGEILQTASPDQIYDDPQDLRVAEFIGSPKINTLPGEVDPEGRVTVLGAPLHRRVAAGERAVTLAARPEHVAIEREGGANAFQARVIHKENLGADVFLHAALEDGGARHRLVVRALPQVARGLSIGAVAWLRLDPDKTLAFNASGARIAFRDPAASALTPPETLGAPLRALAVGV